MKYRVAAYSATRRTVEATGGARFPHRKQISLCVPQQVFEDLKKLALSEEVTISARVRWIITDFLQRNRNDNDSSPKRP